MLTELRIKNLALIKDARVSFGPGLNVITGETGAGKTLLVGALGLLLGAKADSAKVTPGAGETVIQALFTEDAGEVLISRRVRTDGRSRCELNDDLVTIGKMAQMTSSLVSLYGQHQQQLLLSPAQQLGLVDGYAGVGLADELAALRVAYEAGQRVRYAVEKERQAAAERADKDTARETDLWELEQLRPEPGEYPALEEELKLLRHHSQIIEIMSAAAAELTNEDGRGAAERLTAAGSAMSKLPAVHDRFTQWRARLQGITVECQDVSSEISAYLREAVYDPARLEAIQQRLFALDQAAQIRAVASADLGSYWQELRASLTGSGDSGSTLNGLIAELALIDSRKNALARSLTAKRRTAAAGLVKEVMSQLPELGMKEAKIEANIESGGEIGPYGHDKIKFLFSANKGHHLMDLAKVGSGGELSRLMLALRLVEPGAMAVETMIFDEIDTGIGGSTAIRVGEKLARAASGRQAICVTHLPQVAAFGDRHILITKGEDSGVTYASACDLSGDDLLAEIARMQGGMRASDISLMAARELLDAAGVAKARLARA